MEQAVTEVLDDTFLHRLRQCRGIGDDGTQRACRTLAPSERLGRQGEDALEVRGYHEHAGERAICEALQDLRGVEACSDLDEAAEIERAHGERKAGPVGHRRERKEAVVWAVAAVLHGHSVEGQRARPVRDDDALRLAGGARAVDESERMRLVETGQFGFVGRRVPFDPAFVGGTEHDQPAHAIAETERDRLTRHRFQRRVYHHHRGRAVAAGRRDLCRGAARIQRDDDAARVAETAEHLGILRAVGCEHRHTIPELDADLTQRRSG